MTVGSLCDSRVGYGFRDFDALRLTETGSQEMATDDQAALDIDARPRNTPYELHGRMTDG